MASETAQLLQVGLNSWIIADGNYADFTVGEVRSFALEFYNEADLHPLPESQTACAYKSLGRYPEALADFDQASELDSDNPQYYGQRGDVHIRSTPTARQKGDAIVTSSCE